MNPGRCQHAVLARERRKARVYADGRVEYGY
jgi:hypothetical protein